MASTDKQVAPHITMSLSAIYTHSKSSARIVEMVKIALPILRTLLHFDENVTIRVAPIKARNTNGRYYAGEKVAEIDCRLSVSKALEVLCHELVHAEQYYTGRLAWNGRTQYWNGEASYNRGTTYNAYREQPWEQEAFDRQAKLAKKVQEITGGF
jgi:outer membrane protein assembly factor BamB